MSRQIKLVDSDNNHREIKKHSSIIQMSNITSLQERKTLNSLIWVAKDIIKRNKDQRVFTCAIGILKRLSGLKDSDNTTLKKALKNLVHTKMEYNIFGKDDAHERGVFSILSMVKINSKGRGKSTNVIFEFPSMVLDVVKNPNMYVRLNLLILKNLTSKHSIALYELLKDYGNLGKFYCTVEDFRRLMGIKATQYPIFTMLKKRVLDVSVDEINKKTDLDIHYELERYGRKITHIRFFMKTRKAALPKEKSESSIRAKLHALGVKESKIQPLLDHHDEEYLWANIGIVEEQAKKGNIKNITGYLLNAFTNDYRSQETEYSKNKILDDGRKASQNETLLKEQKEVEALKKSFNKIRNSKYNDLVSNLEEEEMKQLQEAFKDKMLNSEMLSKIYLSKGHNSSIVQAQRKNYIVKRFLASTYRDFENYRRSKIENADD